MWEDREEANRLLLECGRSGRRLRTILDIIEEGKARGRVRVRYRCWDAEIVEQAIRAETERAKEGRDKTLHDGRKASLVQDDSMIAGMVFILSHCTMGRCWRWRRAILRNNFGK